MIDFSDIIRFLTGSRTMATVIKIAMLIGRAYDKGLGESHEKIAEFVWEKLPDSYKAPEGPTSRDEIDKAVEHQAKAIEAIYGIFHK